jgi:hypothetical protein
MRIALSLCASADVDPEVSGVCETEVGPDHNEGTDAVPVSFRNSARTGDFPRELRELRWTVLGGVDKSSGSSSWGGVRTDEYVLVEEVLGRGSEWSVCVCGIDEDDEEK